MEHKFVCVECGWEWSDGTEVEDRRALVAHRQATGHGPKFVQADAIDRARWVHYRAPPGTPEQPA